MSALPTISVAECIGIINNTLAYIPRGGFAVEGEVVEYKVAQGKWIYFTLKDETVEARLPCYATVYKGLPPLADGMRVRCSGSFRIFDRSGRFTFEVDAAEPVGEGALAKAYALMKAKLEAEGLFATERKRALPRFPERIGLITSREAAAYGDFCRVLGNRFGGLSIIHADVHVQGQSAVDDIVAAFAAFQKMPAAERPDVLVLTRGGGSLEELHAFNDERVARAVFGSAIPVIVGVGHERDETLVDFVADVRASTPSNAAERLVPHRDDVLQAVIGMMDDCEAKLEREVTLRRHALERTTLVLNNFVAALSARVEQGLDNLTRSFDRWRAAVAQRLETAQRLLASSSPTALLERGYAIVAGRHGVLRSPQDVADGEELRITLAQGMLRAVADKEKNQGTLL